MTFRTAVLLPMLLLLVGVLGASVLAIQRVVGEAGERRLGDDLARTRRVVEEHERLERSLLLAKVGAVAAEPRLKAVTATADVSRETVLGVVEEMGRAVSADFLLLTDQDGVLIADSMNPSGSGDSLAGDRVIAAALVDGLATGTWIAGRRVYRVAARRLTFGATVVGVAVVGAELDDRHAEALRRQAGVPVVLELDGRTIARAPADLGELRLRPTAVGGELATVTIGGTAYRSEQLGVDPATPGLRYVVLHDRDAATAMERQLTRTLYLIALGGVIVAAILAFAVATWLARPIDRLVALAAAVGERQPRRPAPVRGPREVRILGASIDRMIGELQRWNGQLEARVDERTRELRSAHDAIANGARLLETVYEAIPDPVLVFDRAGTTIAANPAADALLGRTRGELLGLPATAIIDPAPAHPGATEVAVRDERVGHPRTGGPIPVLYSARALAEGGEHRGWVCALVDVRDRRRLELELRRAQKLESLGRLAAGVAHEINTPTQFVADNLAFVAEGWDLTARLIATADAELRRQLDPELMRRIDGVVGEMPGALEDIRQGVTQISSIVLSMRQFAHPGGELALPIDLLASIRGVLVLARKELRGIRVITELESIPPLDGYASELHQVLLNIVVNAAHAIEDRARDQGVIRITVRRDGSGVLIAISDNGGGIAPEIRHRVFDPFFTTKPVGRGSGQGLAIAHAIVLKHGGGLTFETEIGHGTTFIVRLPLTAGASAGPGDSARRRRTSSAGPWTPASPRSG